MTANYTGFSPTELLVSVPNRFFYGLRRTDNGEAFIQKIDQLKNDDSLQINDPGPIEDNFPNFEDGQDFFEGRDSQHNLVYNNLNYEQFKWDKANIYYYIDDEGFLTARINQTFQYNDLSSSDGLE